MPFRLGWLLLLLSACHPSDGMMLLVTVDTLRADHLGAYTSDLGLTPHLDALAAESIQFEAAYAPAPFTMPSIASLHTGRFPDETGVYGNFGRVPDDIPLLSEALSQAGWQTAAVVSNYVLRESSGLRRGFEIYDDEMQQREAVRDVVERTAEHTTDAALAALDRLRVERRGRIFLWVHYQDPHGPYTPPDGFRDRFLEKERQRPGGSQRLGVLPGLHGGGGIPSYQYLAPVRNVAFYRAGYSGEVQFTDEQIGRLLAEIAERGLYDDALIAFAADHGEGLGEWDYWFSHGQSVGDEAVWVPLLIRLPRGQPGKRHDLVSLVDLAPTLLSYAGVPNAHRTRGRDLLAPDASSKSTPSPLLGGAPAGEQALVTRAYKLILTSDGKSVRLYERGNEGVDADLSRKRPRLTRSMWAALRQLRDSLGSRPPEPRVLSQEEIDRLRALGYATDGMGVSPD